jgi:hypothetical protein
MKQFADADGSEWIASAREEQTPRHHGRWFLIFQPAGDPAGGDDVHLAMPEVRWQTKETAARTLQSMSIFELRRRLHILRERALLEPGASPDDGATPTAVRERTSASAG